MRPNKKSKWLIGGEGGQCSGLVEKATLRKQSMMLIGGERGNELIQYKLRKNVLFLFLFCMQTNKIDSKVITRLPDMPREGTNNNFSINM